MIQDVALEDSRDRRNCALRVCGIVVSWARDGIAWRNDMNFAMWMGET